VTTPDASGTPASRDNRFILIPALTFIVGLVLGGALVWVGSDRGDDDPQAGPGGAASPAATTPGNGGEPGATEPTDVTVTVPSECVDAAEQAQEVLDLAQQAAQAIGDFDAQRLRSLVEEMEELEPAIRSSASACQEARNA
jgi:hypothetical protein